MINNNQTNERKPAETVATTGDNSNRRPRHANQNGNGEMNGSRRTEHPQNRNRRPENKSAESRPAEIKPAEIKPAESRPTQRNHNGGQTRNKTSNSPAVKMKNPGGRLKVIPLGGLNEIGKNITVLEYDNDIIIIDCGMSFPEDEMYGIDIVIPDFAYLLKNRDKIRAVVITHGHEDHIGAVPYFMKSFDVPIYCTRLTMGLIGNKLKEHNVSPRRLTPIASGDILKLGVFTVEVIRTTHSIADAVCFSIDTPEGVVFHTGDFKVDYTPLSGDPIDFHKLAHIGNKGVLLLMADSTNAGRKGFTASEKNVGATLDAVFRDAEGRIIIATFASNVHRVQSIVDTAVKYGRKIAISGRSMVNVMEVASELGYLKIPKGTFVDIGKIKGLDDDKIVLVTTGSQGEPMSALSRMASSDHKMVQIKRGDTVILSSSPIPGNEKAVSNILNSLMEKGAHVVHSDIADIHVSGHACEEELKLIHTLIKPKFFAPVHGEYRHLLQHSTIAQDLGMSKDNIFIMENGSCLQFENGEAALGNQVSTGSVMVDGLGVGDVGNIVLRDRKLLSEGGLIIVVASISREHGKISSGPDIVSRGFVYVRESEDLIESARDTVRKKMEQCLNDGIKDWAGLKNAVREELRDFIYAKTKRNPVILPIFMEV